MRKLRQIHLYLGCFFAPLFLFYVATGWYQTVSTQRMKSVGERNDWIGALMSIHVDQVLPSEEAETYSTGLFKFLVIAMSISLIATVVIGIFLAFRSCRRPWLVWALLGTGMLAPYVILRLGQNQ